MSYLFYIIFGLTPSIVWLLFYLRKDSHPEPNRLILKIFFCGAGAAVLAAFLEMGFFEITRIGARFIAPVIVNIVNIFIGVALVEEMLKYSVVRIGILKNPEFDEPVDAMLYMIIAALGFAALENILILWFHQKPFLLFETMTWSAARFLGATFLHALCSGTVGYFLALSFFKRKKGEGESRLAPTMTLAIGLAGAVLLHGLYNFSIMSIEGVQRFIVPGIILIGLAIFVSLGFKKLRGAGLKG